MSPTHEDAWLRLAQIDADRRGGHLGPDGIAALSRAYDVEPYETGPSFVRRAFVFKHVGDLPPDLRAQVDQESSAMTHLAGQAEQRPAQ